MAKSGKGSQQKQPQFRKAPTRAAMTALLYLLVIAGVGLATWGWFRTRTPKPAPPSKVVATAASDRYVTLPFPSGFVLDRVAKLVWNRCPIGTTLGQDEAGPLCTGKADWITIRFAQATAKHFASYGDAWRLPTIAELKALPVSEMCCHTLDPIVFPVMQEPPSRLTATSLLKRYAFHSSDVDETRRVSWRLDVATGKAQEIALREEAFVRLVRNATEEEIRSLAGASPIDQSGRAKADQRLTPPATPRSNEYISARDQAIRSGEILNEGCNSSYPAGDSLRGCMNGIEANVHTRYRDGADWAELHRPSKSHECTLEDPIANMGCLQHFRKYLGDIFPDLPETTTSSECRLDVLTIENISKKYREALHQRIDPREALAVEGNLQSCRIYDEAHAKGEKIPHRPGFEGGPSPY